MLGTLALVLSLQVTYVANEGFLIASGEDKVLIDALLSGGLEEYLAPSPSTLDELQGARGSFRGVDIVLVSHRHVDHFDPAVVARHLESNPDARLVSTPEMVKPVREKLSSDSAPGRIVEAPYPEDASRFRHTASGIEVQVLRLDHEGFPDNVVQNLGHLIEIDGKTLFHVGDALMTRENFSRHRLPEERIDIAFLPYWYLLSAEGRSFVREQVAPRQIVAIHVPPAEVEDAARKIRQHLPDVVIFARSGDTKTF